MAWVLEYTKLLQLVKRLLELNEFSFVILGKATLLCGGSAGPMLRLNVHSSLDRLGICIFPAKF